MPAPTKKAKLAAAKKAFEDMSPSEQVAHEIVATFGDLAPSVRRIMEAELTEDQRHRAITMFRAALNNIGDPYRDPRYAIANCGEPV